MTSNVLHWLLPLLIMGGIFQNTTAQNPASENLTTDSLLHRAQKAASAKDFDQARQYLLRATTQAASDSTKAKVAIQLGDVLTAENKFAEAGTEFERAVNLTKNLPDSRDLQVTGYMKWLSVLLNARQLEKAESVLEDARMVARQAEDPKQMASEMVNLENMAANTFYYRKDIPAAIVSYKSAVAISNQYGVKKKLPALYDNIALAYFRSGKPDSTKVYLDLAMAEAISQRDTLILSSSAMHLGNFYWQKGLLDSAITNFERCKYWSTLLENDWRIAISGISVGAVLGEMGQPEKALTAYFEALPILEKNNPREFARSHGQIAYNYEALNDFVNSRKHYQQALDISRANGSEAEDAMFLAGLARADWQEGNRENAFQKIAEAKTAKEYGTDQSIRAHLALTEGTFLVKAGSPERGLQLFYEALETFEKIDEKSMTGAVLVEIGKAYQLLEKGEVASSQFDVESLLQRGLEMARQVGKLQSEKIALSALADFYEKNNQPARATPLLRELLVLSDSLFAKDRTAIIAELNTQYETEKKEQENALLKTQNDLISQQKNNLLLAAGVLAVLLAGMAWLYFQMRQAKAKIDEQAKELSQLNATKDRLFAIISHDLRSEISAFTSLGKIFNFHLGKGNLERLQELSTQVNRSANNLSTLLDNLLQWSVSQLEGISLNPQPLNLRQQTEEVIGLFEQHAQAKGIALENETEPDLQAIADENSLQLILRNLVSNALKFTDEGGVVRISSTQQNGQVRLSVTDTGLGIPADKINTLFTLNRQGSSKGTDGERGTGLGLALTKEFVERNGGGVTIESEVGKGTVCNITLPMG